MATIKELAFLCIKEIVKEEPDFKKPVLEQLEMAQTKEEFLSVLETHSVSQHTKYTNLFMTIGRYLLTARKIPQQAESQT